jgi:hypothetical protein
MGLRMLTGGLLRRGATTERRRSSSVRARPAAAVRPDVRGRCHGFVPPGAKGRKHNGGECRTATVITGYGRGSTQGVRAGVARRVTVPVRSDRNRPPPQGKDAYPLFVNSPCSSLACGAAWHGGVDPVAYVPVEPAVPGAATGARRRGGGGAWRSPFPPAGTGSRRRAARRSGTCMSHERERSTASVRSRPRCKLSAET